MFLVSNVCKQHRKCVGNLSGPSEAPGGYREDPKALQEMLSYRMHLDVLNRVIKSGLSNTQTHHYLTN